MQLTFYRNFDYSQLNVSPELKELFDYIDRFKPSEIELDTKLKPFVPEYIPAVGDIDAFIKVYCYIYFSVDIDKVTRPDEKVDNLGLSVLDEPSSKQTDPTGKLIIFYKSLIITSI